MYNYLMSKYTIIVHALIPSKQYKLNGLRNILTKSEVCSPGFGRCFKTVYERRKMTTPTYSKEQQNDQQQKITDYKIRRKLFQESFIPKTEFLFFFQNLV